MSLVFSPGLKFAEKRFSHTTFIVLHARSFFARIKLHLSLPQRSTCDGYVKITNFLIHKWRRTYVGIKNPHGTRGTGPPKFESFADFHKSANYTNSPLITVSKSAINQTWERIEQTFRFIFVPCPRAFPWFSWSWNKYHQLHRLPEI